MASEYRTWLIVNGYCVHCCKEKVWKNRRMCSECLHISAERSERTRSDESKVQRRNYMKRKRELCDALGVCRECMCRDVKKNYKRCVRCIIKDNRRRHENKKDIARHERPSYGLCYFCGNAVTQGKRTCEKHRAIMASNLKRDQLDNRSHYWRKFTSAEIRYMKSEKSVR